MNYYSHTAEDSEARTIYTLKDGGQTTEKPRLSDLAEEQVGLPALKTHLTNVTEQAIALARARSGSPKKLALPALCGIW